MNVLVVSDTAHPSYDGAEADDEDFLMVARPYDPLFGHRFDLIVAPGTSRQSASDQVHYEQWWTVEVLCRLNPGGRIVRT